eukprot:scaffold12352_cov129-Isochrysis_galbana.AAC.6
MLWARVHMDINKNADAGGDSFGPRGRIDDTSLNPGCLKPTNQQPGYSQQPTPQRPPLSPGDVCGMLYVVVQAPYKKAIFSESAMASPADARGLAPRTT